MAKLYRFWYTFGMTYYDRIFEEAIGNYGLITSAQAKAIGIPSVELVKLAQRGRLARLGYGVYKLTQYSPAPDGRDAYADSLALVDKDAYLYGQSVLALHHLCPTNPSRIYIASPRRIRKKLSKGIQIMDSTPCEELEWYEGLPSQSISLAIRTARGTVMDERLCEAIKTARQNDLIDDKSVHELERFLNEQAS